MEINSLFLFKMSDRAIAEQLAAFIRNNRLEQNKTQNDLATIAGVTRRTISAFESGQKNITILTLIQLLRALNCLHVLNEFKSGSQISPIQLAKIEQQKRKRARGKNQGNKPTKSDW